MTATAPATPSPWTFHRAAALCLRVWCRAGSATGKTPSRERMSGRREMRRRRESMARASVLRGRGRRRGGTPGRQGVLWVGRRSGNLPTEPSRQQCHEAREVIHKGGQVAPGGGHDPHQADDHHHHERDVLVDYQYRRDPVDKEALAASLERGWSSRKKKLMSDEKDAQKKTGEGTMTPDEESEMEANNSEEYHLMMSVRYQQAAKEAAMKEQTTGKEQTQAAMEVRDNASGMSASGEGSSGS